MKFFSSRCSVCPSAYFLLLFAILEVEFDESIAISKSPFLYAHCDVLDVHAHIVAALYKKQLTPHIPHCAWTSIIFKMVFCAVEKPVNALHTHTIYFDPTQCSPVNFELKLHTSTQIRMKKKKKLKKKNIKREKATKSHINESKLFSRRRKKTETDLILFLCVSAVSGSHCHCRHRHHCYLLLNFRTRAS